VPSAKRARQREGRQLRQEELKAAQRRSRQRSIVVRFLAVTVIAFVVVFLITRAQKDDKVAAKTPASSTTTEASTATTAKPKTGDAAFGTTACPAADGSSPKTMSFPAPFAKCIDPAKTYTAKIVTDVGEYTVALDPKVAPVTVNNFVALARFHYFDGLTYHRVIPDFVIQGGDPEGTGSGGPGYQFADELPKAGAYKVGSLAMANSGPDTNGSQYFVITGPQGVQLPPSYSLFGQVTQGLDVVKKIEADGTPAGKPNVVHKMTSVTITEGS
jgi:cyclophilin family peptidyl-prolyl cis-trans isomerase